MSGVEGGIAGIKFKQQLIFFLSISLQLIQGLGDNPPNSKGGAKAEASSKSSDNNGHAVLLICLGAIVVIGTAFLLFKLWQKRKREEQHARLLRLFEEDDELEVELGLRD